MEQRVKGPAIAMIAVMGISVLAGAFNLVSYLVGAANPLIPQEFANDREIDPTIEFFAGDGFAVLNLVCILSGAFVIYAMMQMMHLKHYGLSMAGIIVGILPCVSPCCFLGLPFGIWAFTVINEPEVKKSFK